MPSRNNRLFALLITLTVFLSAFLLFQVQPLISKFILPWFGGTPAVWTTAMMFFQLALLLGYLYAHVLAMRLNPRTQILVHCGLLVLAALTLPIRPDESWKPTGAESTSPAIQIVILLGATVGLPYMMLASTGPLLQVWFGRRLPGASPWRLYALSNVGSMLGLLTFPFVVEPNWTSNFQADVWSWAFAAFALLCAVSGFLSLNPSASSEENSETDNAETSSNAPRTTDSKSARLADQIGFVKVSLWVAYPAFATIMLLALTHHLCQDVAVVPFLWVAPLCLYLLSFIICFDNERWYKPWLFGTLAIVGVSLVSAIMAKATVDEYLVAFGFAEEDAWRKIASGIMLQASADLLALFGICMVCHGELVRTKPGVNRLTAFYLTVATGGAIGGLFVGIVCPLLFSDYVELHLGLAMGFIVSAVVFFEYIDQRFRKKWLSYSTLTLIFVGTIGIAWSQWKRMEGQHFSVRNFYGALHVNEYQVADSGAVQRRLINGQILHGVQVVGDGYDRRPTSYYGPDSGIGVALEILHESGSFRMGAIGLGVGTLATYGEAGDTIRFYEINPDVIRIAQEQFSFLGDCPADIEIVEGDARLSMEREEPQNYDAIAIDAFSSDSIPVHLLTSEAFDVFRRHIHDEGILAFHISNRYLELLPVVKRICEEKSLHFSVIESPEVEEEFLQGATWVLVSANADRLAHSEIVVRESFPDTRDVSLWTDQFSNLTEVLR